MAFNNVTFPTYPMIHGLSKTVTDPVSVSSNGTYEYRVKRTRWERYSWSLAVQSMTDTQKEDIKNFLIKRGHALNSFKFTDPDMSAFSDAVLAYNSSTLWNLALPFDTATAGTHPIFNTTVGSLTVTVNGGAGTINSFQITNGIPTIDVVGTISTDVVKVTGPIDFTVRLDGGLSYALLALDDCAGTNTPTFHTVSAIKLTEVYGEV